WRHTRGAAPTVMNAAPVRSRCEPGRRADTDSEAHRASPPAHLPSTRSPFDHSTLSTPSRVRILARLRESPCSVGEFAVGKENRMDLVRLEARLARAFRARPQLLGEARIVWRRRPILLWQWVEVLTDEADWTEFGKGCLQDWPGN